MAQLNESTRSGAPAPRKSTGIIVLLVLLSLGNLVTLVASVAGWVDAVDHGDEDASLAFALATFTSVPALVGIGGAWFTRKWGPRLYVLAAGLGLLLGLAITGGEGFSPLNLVGVALAVVLWLNAESNW